MEKQQKNAQEDMGILERMSEAVEVTEETKNSIKSLMGLVMLEWKCFEDRLELIRNSFTEGLTELEHREKQLNSAQVSVRESLQEFDSRTKWMEERLEKVEEKEKLVNGLLQEMERKEKQFVDNIHEKLKEIDLKQQQLEGFSRELNLIQNQMEIRANELDLKEKRLEKHEKELGVKEKILELRFELGLQERKLAGIQKSHEKECMNENKSITVHSRKRNQNSGIESCRNNAGDTQDLEMGEKYGKYSKRRRGNDDAEKITAPDDLGESDSDSSHSDLGSIYKPDYSNEIDDQVDLDYYEPDSDSGENEVSKPIDKTGALLNDVEKKKNNQLDRFEVGQIWSCFDGKDRLPRSYVRVTKVLNNDVNFKLQIVLLQPVPRFRYEENWINADLPVGCGMFKLGNRRILYPGSFSHQVFCKKLGKCKPYFIRPRKGETWAIYKDWNIVTWSSHPENQKQCKYEIVEIVSYEGGSSGIKVAYLNKLEGHASSFQRRSPNESVLIRPSRLFRFSHRVPSAKKTCNESFGVPNGVFELELRSLPPGL